MASKNCLIIFVLMINFLQVTTAMKRLPKFINNKYGLSGQAGPINRIHYVCTHRKIVNSYKSTIFSIVTPNLQRVMELCKCYRMVYRSYDNMDIRKGQKKQLSLIQCTDVLFDMYEIYQSYGALHFSKEAQKTRFGITFEMDPSSSFP